MHVLVCPAGELFGRGLKLTVPGHLTGQPPQTHEFAFDRVFAQSASQEGVFEEISELVQSALDGHKVRYTWHACYLLGIIRLQLRHSRNV